jgi:hypothetical protein
MYLPLHVPYLGNEQHGGGEEHDEDAAGGQDGGGAEGARGRSGDGRADWG